MNHLFQALCGVEGVGILYLLVRLYHVKITAKAEVEKKALLRYIARLQADAQKVEHSSEHRVCELCQRVVARFKMINGKITCSNCEVGGK